MTSSSFLFNPTDILVIDASVIINLRASGHARAILKALAVRCVATENAAVELERGTANNHNDIHELRAWAAEGLVEIVQLNPEAVELYEKLVGGNALRTLGDGEAATIAYAEHANAVAAIDERKARTICDESFPTLRLVSTVGLLLEGDVAYVLGEAGQIEAVMNALQKARMQVLPNQAAQVVALIGEERAALCPSLPRSIRQKVST